jgi:hypothetical protein
MFFFRTPIPPTAAPKTRYDQNKDDQVGSLFSLRGVSAFFRKKIYEVFSDKKRAGIKLFAYFVKVILLQSIS